jgi:hypothetical protein
MMLCDYVLDYVIDDAMVLWFDAMVLWLMVWCYLFDDMVLLFDDMQWHYIYICYIYFGMQGFKIKQTKTKFTGAFAVCRHTTMRTKVLYHVLTHGKDAMCQQSVDLGVVFWSKWSEN